MKPGNWMTSAKAAMGIIHGERAFGGPLQAAISLTNRCNIRCIHCFFYSPYIDGPNLLALRRARQRAEQPPAREYLQDLQRRDADVEITKSLIHDLVRSGTRKFFFTGSGEPFLHRNALDFMGLAKHFGSTCIVNTNGTLLSREVLDELIRIEFNELKITTLAGSREVYMRTHPGVQYETFDKLRGSLLYLAERKAELGVNFPKVNLVFFPIPHNSGEIHRFVELAEYVHADSVSFRPIDTADDPGLKEYLVPTAGQAVAVKKQLTDVRVHLEMLGITHNIDLFLKAFKEKLDTVNLYGFIPCYYGWLSVRIDVDGQVYPCCRCYEPLGNVYKKKFTEIWYGPDYRTFRKKSLKINRGQQYAHGCNCGSCPHYTANILVFRALHPFKSRSSTLKRLSPAAGGAMEVNHMDK